MKYHMKYRQDTLFKFESLMIREKMFFETFELENLLRRREHVRFNRFRKNL